MRTSPANEAIASLAMLGVPGYLGYPLLHSISFCLMISAQYDVCISVLFVYILYVRVSRGPGS